MAGLLDLLKLSQDAAGAARSAAQLAQENLIGSTDPRYEKRVAPTEIEVAGGKIISVVSGVPMRVVDDRIVAAKRNQQSDVNVKETTQKFFELFDGLSGSPDSDNGMDKKILNFFQQCISLQNDPNSPILRRNAIESVKNFLDTVHVFTKGINDQRNSAEKDLMAAVQEVNSLSTQIFSLNQQISDASYGGQDLSALETKRETLIEDLAKLTDIHVVHAENQLFVYTSSGRPLVEYDKYELTYASSGYIDYSAEYPTNINSINLADGKGGVIDVTSEFANGKIGACLKMRDQVYPQYQKAIDKFAEIFQHEINRAHNKGAGFPPASKLNGRFFVADTDKDTNIPWKEDSTVRIALIDHTGKFAEVNGEFHLDLNLNPSGGGGLTPSQIRDAINTHFSEEIAIFSESDHGYLSLEAPNGLRIAIGSVDGEVPGETDVGIGFSEYFRLNDLLESSSDAIGRGYANSLKVCPEVLENVNLLATGKLNSSVDIALVGTGAETVGVASGDGKNLVDIIHLINSASIDFPLAGAMSPQISSFSGYLTNMIESIRLSKTSAVSQQEFSQEVLESLELRYSMLSGVNQDEEVAEILRQRMIYFGILNTSQHIIDMMKSMLELFGTR